MRDLVMIGIVGCGVRGSEVAAQVGKHLHDRAQIVGVYDTDFVRSGSLASYLGTHVRMFTSIEDLIDRARLVVEVASNDAVVPLVPLALKANRDVLITSVAGLLEHPEIFEQAQTSYGRLLIPSGIIAGVDALKSCMAGTVKSVSLTSRFPRGMLGDAPYVREHDVDIDSVSKDTVIFEGMALEACRAFPVMANAAVTVALAGPGLREVHTTVVVTRRYKAPSHELEITGDFGRVITRTENVLLPTYPQLTYQELHSAVAKLQEYVDSISVGT
jgi:aspartate dehydrogenase